MDLINYWLWELLRASFMIFANLMLWFAIGIILSLICYVIYSAIFKNS